MYGTLTRYIKLRVAHAPGMPGTFSPPPRVSDPDMHHGTCGTHVPWCMPGSLTSGFLWSRWRGKCSRPSRRMRNPPFYVSGKISFSVAIFCSQMKIEWGNRAFKTSFPSYTNTFIVLPRTVLPIDDTEFSHFYVLQIQKGFRLSQENTPPWKHFHITIVRTTTTGSAAIW